MDFQKALGGMMTVNSMRVYPLLAVAALRLYLKGADSPKVRSDIKARLSKFRERFVSVFLEYDSSPSVAMRKGVDVFSAIQALFDDQDKRTEMVKSLQDIDDHIGLIISGTHVAKKAIAKDIQTLNNLVDQSRRLPKAEYEAFLLGQPLPPRVTLDDRYS